MSSLQNIENNSNNIANNITMNSKWCVYVKKRLKRSYVLLNKRSNHRQRPKKVKNIERRTTSFHRVRIDRSGAFRFSESIKPILVHHPHSRESSASSSHHVHVEDEHQDDQTLTPEERGERNPSISTFCELRFVCSFRTQKTIRIETKETLQ